MSVTSKPKNKGRTTFRETIRTLPDGGLVLALPAQEPAVQRRICFELGRRHSQQASSALTKLLSSPDSTVRAAAAEALGRIGGQEAGPALVNLLRRSTEPEHVRDTSAYALARLKYLPALPELRRALADPSPRVRVCVIAALGVIGGSSVHRDLQMAYQIENDPRVKDALRRALRGLKEPPKRFPVAYLPLVTNPGLGQIAVAYSSTVPAHVPGYAVLNVSGSVAVPSPAPIRSYPADTSLALDTLNAAP